MEPKPIRDGAKGNKVYSIEDTVMINNAEILRGWAERQDMDPSKLTNVNDRVMHLLREITPENKEDKMAAAKELMA